MHPGAVRFSVAIQLQRRGVEAKLVMQFAGDRSSKPDTRLVAVDADAHRWVCDLAEGRAASVRDLARQNNRDAADISRTLPLAFLAPVIIEAIMEGRQLVALTRPGRSSGSECCPVPGTISAAAWASPCKGTPYFSIPRLMVWTREPPVETFAGKAPHEVENGVSAYRGRRHRRYKSRKRRPLLKSRNGRPAWRDWVVGRAGLEPATTPL